MEQSIIIQAILAVVGLAVLYFIIYNAVRNAIKDTRKES